MKDITKTFPGVHALDHFSFNLCAGEVHALVGENGAGKSTLMKILYGVYAPDEGEIFIEGEKISRKSRKCIGYMPENTPPHKTRKRHSSSG